MTKKPPKRQCFTIVSLLILSLFIQYTIIGCGIPAESHTPKKPWDSTSKNSPLPIQSAPEPSTEESQTQTPQAQSKSQLQSQSLVSNKLRVHFIDVGQADSILIVSPAGKTMLIDAAENEDGDTVVSYIRNLGISKLDIVVGSHPHSDHIGGLDIVIDALEIGQVVMPNKTYTSTSYKDVLKAIEAKGLKITTAKAGVRLDLGKEVTTTIIAPIQPDYEAINDYSAVIKCVYNNTSYLFTADAQAESEYDMIDSGTNLSATVLKVPHHGSVTSSTSSFLKKVAPKHAVISVGKDNEYGHPDEKILIRLADIGAEIYRTDMSGNIVSTSDGSVVTFNVAPFTP